ncbi:MAG TPA: carbohydrate kinase family protein [Candidatus Acidoferrum sp.]|nr:carbohydrate kinase family protein [Candidatus Acidoferrum sp.]
MPPLDVCVVGEINPDLILSGLPTELKPEREELIEGFRITLGSSSAIFAHNLAALGTKVGIVSKIGSDAFGKMSLEWLEEAGVETSKVNSTGHTPTGVTLILSKPEHRYILTYPGTMFELRYQDLDLDYVFSARHLHVSSFFLHRALRPRLAELFRVAKERGLSTSLDTNDDPADEWGGGLDELLPFVDLLFPNEREALKISRESDIGRAAQKLSKICGGVVIKLGSRGAFARIRQEEFRCEHLTVRVKDAIGAGDSFDAGYIHRFLQGAGPQECLDYANLAGGFSTTCQGGIEAFRHREEVRRIFSEQFFLRDR